MRVNTRNFTVFNTDFAIDKVQDSLNLPAFVTTNNSEHQICFRVLDHKILIWVTHDENKETIVLQQ